MVKLLCGAPPVATAPSWRARYHAYLLSPQWQRRRRTVIARAAGACERCAGAGPLQVHHLTYDRMFHERLTDLVVLCEGCHEVADMERRSAVEDARRGRRRRSRKVAPQW